MNREIHFNDFEIGKKIGNGNFAEVYLVTDKKTDKLYAAKRLLTSINLHPNKEEICKMNDKELAEIRNFRREIGILSMISYPAIISYIGYTPKFSAIYPCPTIIMEYASGMSLADILKLDKLSFAPPEWDQTKKFINIYGIAKGMAFLHDKKIIHRDLKPDNVMLNNLLYPKIADFGLSKVYNPLMRSQSMIRTTGPYMAPELFVSDVYDCKVDVYAFSMILYEIFTLKKPFSEVKGQHQLIKLIQNNIRPEIPDNASIPKEFIQIIQLCWQQDPNDRPSFSEICSLLESNNFEMSVKMDVDQKALLDYVYYLNGEQNESTTLTNEDDAENNSGDLVQFDVQEVATHQPIDKNDYSSSEYSSANFKSDPTFQYSNQVAKKGEVSKFVKFEQHPTKSFTLLPNARTRYQKSNTILQKASSAQVKSKSSSSGRKTSTPVKTNEANNGKTSDSNYSEDDNSDFENGDEIRESKSQNDVIDLLEPIFPFSQLESLADWRKKYIEDAELTDSDAMTYVGQCLIDGSDGFPKDIDSGMKFLSKAVIFGNCEAMLIYGDLLIKGEKIPKNVKKGVEMLRRASNNHNNSAAKLMLAKMQLVPEKDETDFVTSPENYVAAKRYSKEAADNGNVDAMVLYATLCMKDKSNEHGKIHRNMKEAMKYLKVAVNGGSKEAMALYGQLIDQNDNIDRDSILYYKKSNELGSYSGKALYGYEKAKDEDTEEEGLKLVVDSMEKGNPIGINLHGMILFNGLFGVDVDKEKAVNEFRVAAEAGNAKAMYNYAHCLEKGEGVTKNFQEAFKYYKKAFQDGEIRAAKNIANMLFKGDNESGFPMNYAEGKRYLKILADAKYPSGINLYVCSLLAGMGIKTNIQKAVCYLKNGIDINDPNSYYLYGLLLLSGYASHKNSSIISKLYIQKAADLGNEEAIEKGEQFIQKKGNVKKGIREAIDYIKKFYQKD